MEYILGALIAIDLVYVGRRVYDHLVWRKRMKECAARNRRVMREFIRKDMGRLTR